jgi:hypothetical protein
LPIVGIDEAERPEDRKYRGTGKRLGRLGG